jgi:hypothetical protein
MVSLISPGMAVAHATEAPAQADGSIAGAAHSLKGRALTAAVLRLRSVSSGHIAGTATTDAAGHFMFHALAAGDYVVEALAADGTVAGSSAVISLPAGGHVPDVSLSASSAASAAESFFATKTGLIVLIAAAAGVVSMTVPAKHAASPSK